tara:strand:- start:5210 stop:6772 length:1563 start_codon:yes stop_codon:yes gene_type:complete
MNNFLVFLILFTVLLILIAYFQIKTIEQFTSDLPTEDKLFIKKTNQYTKIFSNKKYNIWLPDNIDDYYPTGVLYTSKKNKSPPKVMSVLVKNEYGEDGKDKPVKYEIMAITNNNNAFWTPVPNKNYKSLGILCSKEYPSKFLIRCVPSKYTLKTNILNKLISNNIGSIDKGYELWSVNNSNNIVVNNLNNADNIDSLKQIHRLNIAKCTTEKKLYMKYTTSYEKIAEYKDQKTGNEFFIWKPKPPNKFCVVGYVCLTRNNDPNRKLKTIVVHKSCCKIPNNYGKRSLINFGSNEESSISFWRPIAPKNYVSLGDIVVKGENEPNSDNLIHCISLDYVNEVKNAHKMIWNNIDSQKSASIWVDDNNILHVNNGYTNKRFHSYSLNKNLFTSDNDLLDEVKTLQINYRINNNSSSKIGRNKMEKLLRQTLTSKLDIHDNRLKNINIDEDHIELTIDARRSGSSELNVKEVLLKLKNILDNGDIKVFNEEKNNYYIIIDNFVIKNLDTNSVLIDNSRFLDKYN